MLHPRYEQKQKDIMVVINVFGVDDFFWKRVTDQQLQQDASYETKNCLFIRSLERNGINQILAN